MPVINAPAITALDGESKSDFLADLFACALNLLTLFPVIDENRFWFQF